MRITPRIGALVTAARGGFPFDLGGEAFLRPFCEFLRIDDRKAARETYEDEMRRYNPGGGFEPGSMRKVIDRARDTRKMERKVEIQDVFDLSMAAEVEVMCKLADKDEAPSA